MHEPAEFGDQIALTRSEVFDVVALCDEIVTRAEALGEVEIALAVDSVRRLLLGRLMGEPGGLEG